MKKRNKILKIILTIALLATEIKLCNAEIGDVQTLPGIPPGGDASNNFILQTPAIFGNNMIEKGEEGSQEQKPNNPGTDNNPGNNYPGEETPKDEEGTYEEKNQVQVDDKLIAYTYTYKLSAGANSEIGYDIFDLNGESILKENDINYLKNNYKFKAGTWVGITILEIQSSFWQLYVDSFEFSEVKVEITCSYTRNVINSCSVLPNNGKCPDTSRCIAQKNADENTYMCYCTGLPYCSPKKETLTKKYTKEYFAERTCDAINGYGPGVKIDEKEIEGPIDENDSTIQAEIEKIKATEAKKLDAAARAAVGNPTGKIKYIKTDDLSVDNKYCVENPNECYGYVEAVSRNGIQAGPTDGKTYGSYSILYEYLEENVCIDIKNSNVTYGRECNEKEMKIENGQATNYRYWHYFIPLNTKSNSDFWIEIGNNSTRNLSVEECVGFMQYISSINQNYKDYLSPNTVELFTGDYIQNGTHSQDYQRLQEGNGCKMSAKIVFPIKQEFYNETTNKDGNKKFKGFNFYYKPIDINNPFPNGLSDTSIWKEWYDNVKDDKKATPDISKSFDEVTYIAENINANKVRKYTKDNPYTSWKNISLSGRSSFIENEGIVTRNENISFYKLGCGPYNSEWSECK